jgi:hypothetical protein
MRHIQKGCKPVAPETQNIHQEIRPETPFPPLPVWLLTYAKDNNRLATQGQMLALL